MSEALDLFGEPARTAELSQYFTPMWLAERSARWIPLETAGRATRVLEPSAGRGNLVAGMLRAGFSQRVITLVEKDPRWFAALDASYPIAAKSCADFLSWEPLTDERFDYALMNPPYEEGADAEHVVHALAFCNRVIALVKSDFEFSAERERVLWHRARVRRRAILVDRPEFGETVEKAGFGPARNYVVLEIEPAPSPRVFLAYNVVEERWRKRVSA
jgi:predicted RNA methylase